MAAKGRRGKKKKRETNPRWIPDTNLFSSASKLPFDLRGAERFMGTGKRCEVARISFQIADIPGPAAAPGRVQICSARNLHGRHSGFLLCRSKGECKHSFLPEGILVQAERGKREKGKGGQRGSPTSHPSPGKEEVRTTRSAATSKHGVPAQGIGGKMQHMVGGCSAMMSG